MTTAEELEEFFDEITDDHVRALDLHGWMIVSTPETLELLEPGEKIPKWPCDHPAPSWCRDLSEDRQTRRVGELEHALRLVKDRLTRAAGSTTDQATKHDLEALLFEVAAARP